MSQYGTHRRGFTLIELIVVLAIIAIVAGMVIPLVASVGRSADMAATAKAQADMANNIQLFFVMQKRFPQGLDSLVTTDGAIYAARLADGTTAVTSANQNLQAKGLPFGGADGTKLQDQLQVWAIDNTDDSSGTGSGGSFRSFSRCGFDWVHNHDYAIANSNNSSVATQTVLASGMNVARVIPTGTLAAKLVPQGLQTGENLIALGIGPRNTAVGKTIASVPIYPGCDGKYYGRYVAVFKTFTTGERAVLVGVIDSYGRHPDYTLQQYSESLPDGSRQG